MNPEAPKMVTSFGVSVISVMFLSSPFGGAIAVRLRPAPAIS
jgi:hypothetical protein